MSKFRFENHEECDEGGDDSETSNKADNNEDPSRIFVTSCVFVDPKILTIEYDISRVKFLSLLTLQVNL